MKKLLAYPLMVIAAMVAFNVATRTGAPTILLNDVIPGVSDDGWVASGVKAFLLPGTSALWYLGFTPDSRAEVIIAALISWWTWLTVLRLTWSVTGRWFGYYDIATYHYWLRFSIPWRPLYRRWLRFRAWLRQFGYGGGATACWAGPLTALCLPYKPGNSIPLGRPICGGVGLHQPVGIDEKEHTMVIGNTGSGKTVFLLSWVGSLHKKASAVIIDCGAKAANGLANALGRAGHRVSVWDPFGRTKFKTACWNPLDEITQAVKRHGSRGAAVRYALMLARALVREMNEKQQIFCEGAREYIAGDILRTWLLEPQERRNLVTVRQNLTVGRPDLVRDPKQDPFEAHLDDMLDATKLDDGCGGAITALIARGAAVMKSGKSREGNPFRTSAIVATQVIDIPEVAATMTHSDFTLQDLKLSNDCVFICASADEMRTTLSGYACVLTSLQAFVFQNIPQRREIPCGLFLDEAPSIAIENLDTAAATYRQFDIRLVVVTQDLPLLEKAYPKGWRTLMGSAAVRIWLANAEMQTMQYLCDELGSRTVTERVEGASWLARALGLSNIPPRWQRVERPLMYPHQASQFLDREFGNAIATRTGKAPLKLKFDPYFKALGFWRFDADPHFRQPIVKALMRSAFASLFTGGIHGNGH